MRLQVFSAETEVVTEELRKARASAAEQAASNAHATAEEPERRLEERDRAGVSSSREVDGWMVAEVTNIGEPDRAQASETAQISRLAEQTAPSELDTTDEALQARLKITRRSLESANQVHRGVARAVYESLTYSSHDGRRCSSPDASRSRWVADRNTNTGNIFGMHTLHRLQNRTHAHACLDNSHNPQARVEAAERRAALEVIEREANAVQARVQSERDREKSKRSRRRPEGEIDENGCEWGRALSRASRASSRAAADTPHASKGIAPFGASSSEFISGDHAHAGANFRFVCCTANEGYLGDLSIAPRTPWSEMREQLRKLAGRAVTFVFDEPDIERTCCYRKSDAGSRSQELAVGTAVQWHMCLDLLMLHREHFGLQELEINLVPVDSSPAKPQVELAEIKNEAPQVVLVRARDRLQTTKVAARDLECKLATGRCAVALALLRLADARLHAADIDLAQQEFRVVEAKLDVSRVESGLFVPGPGESNAGRDARQGRMLQEEKANVEGQVQLTLEAAEKELEQEQGLQELLAAKAERTTHEHAEAESEYRRLREEYYLGLCTQAIQRLRVVGAQSALHAWHENASAQRSQWMRAEKDTVDRAHATEIARMFEAERCESEDGRLAALLQAVKARAAAQMVFAEADAEMTVAGCCPDSAAMHPSSESCLKVTPYRQKLESERCAAEITAAARVAERKARAEAEVAAVHTEAQAGLVRARAACAAVELKIRCAPALARRVNARKIYLVCFLTGGCPDGTLAQRSGPKH